MKEYITIKKANIEITKEAGRCTIEYDDPTLFLQTCEENEKEAARKMILLLQDVKSPHKYGAMRFLQGVMF